VEECYVVGDAVWDLLAARRGRMFSVGVLSGGYGMDELLAAGAYRVYAMPQSSNTASTSWVCGRNPFATNRRRWRMRLWS